MLVSTYPRRLIERDLIEQYKKKMEEYIPSGRLSAGMLFQPLRYQVMKTLGIPTKKPDAYTLGVFAKGKEVEEKFVDYLKKFNLLAKPDLEWDDKYQQYKAEYRGAIGYIDAVVDTNRFDDIKVGIIPFEIKSVTSFKLKRIKQSGELDWQWKLQAGFYALAMKSHYYAITIISKEHNQPYVYILQTRGIRADIETIIDRYEKAMEDWYREKKLPPLEVDERVKWAIDPKYSMYDNWTDEQILNYLKGAK